jgi:integrase
MTGLGMGRLGSRSCGGEQPRVNRDQRVLSRDELARLLPVLRGASGAYGAAFEFLLLTCCRRGEAAAAVWRDIDFDRREWRLPVTKNGQEHVVPLSAQAIALLRARMPANPDPDGFVFVTTTGGKLGDWHGATKQFMAASNTEGWHRHDLRRSSATMMGEMGIEPHVVEAALGHVALHSQLASVYNRARYRPQVAEALQSLANALDRIVAGGGKVVTLRPPETALRGAHATAAGK